MTCKVTLWVGWVYSKNNTLISDWADEEEYRDEDKTGSDRNFDQSVKQSQVAATLTWYDIKMYFSLNVMFCGLYYF